MVNQLKLLLLLLLQDLEHSLAIVAEAPDTESVILSDKQQQLLHVRHRENVQTDSETELLGC